MAGFKAMKGCSIPTQTAKAAPELPPELWSLILCSQPNLVLKNFRLVCQHWACVGTAWLFNTVYVDNYQQSWGRFQQLASSQYAHQVQRLQWNPLVVPTKALDGDVWRKHYPNLLRDTNDLDSAKLYEKYLQCIRFAQIVMIGNNQPILDFDRLINLHELLLEDDVDTESRCDDSELRRNFHIQTSMHDSVAMWGRHPLMWKAKEGYWNHPAYKNFAALFRLLRGCSTLSDCTMNLWTQHWRPFVEATHSWSPSSDAFAHRTIKNIYMTFKFAEVSMDLLEDSHVSIELQMQQAFQTMRNFPELHNLCIQPRFTDPGPYLRRKWKRKYYGPSYDKLQDCWDCSNGNSTCGCAKSSESITLAEMDTDYFGPPLNRPSRDITSYRAVLHLSFTKIPKLKVLTLCNLTLGINSLLAWLCGRTPYFDTLTIYLKGNLVLYGLTVKLFYRLMSQFGVTVISDETVQYYEINICPMQRTDPIYDRSGKLIGNREMHDKTEDTFWYRYPALVNPHYNIEILAGPSFKRISQHIYQYKPSSMAYQEWTDAAKFTLVFQPQRIEYMVPRRWPSRHWEYSYCMFWNSDGFVNFYWTTHAWHSIRERVVCEILVASSCSESDGYCPDDDPKSPHMESSLSCMLANGDITVFGADGEIDNEYMAWP